jgi:hypothetical protein
MIFTVVTIIFVEPRSHGSCTLLILIASTLVHVVFLRFGRQRISSRCYEPESSVYAYALRRLESWYALLHIMRYGSRVLMVNTVGIGLSIACVIVGLGFLVNFLIIGVPSWTNKSTTRTTGNGSPDTYAEHKIFSAERTPLRETASVITWTSYTPRTISKSTIGNHLSQILRFSRQNTDEDKEKGRSKSV